MGLPFIEFARIDQSNSIKNGMGSSNAEVDKSQLGR